MRLISIGCAFKMVPLFYRRKKLPPLPRMESRRSPLYRRRFIITFAINEPRTHCKSGSRQLVDETLGGSCKVRNDLLPVLTANCWYHKRSYNFIFLVLQ